MDNKERAENGLPEYKEAIRKCLNCSTDFLSEWRGNRICLKCKESQANSEEYNFSSDIKFIYDMTVESILTHQNITGNSESNYEDKGFYED